MLLCNDEFESSVQGSLFSLQSRDTVSLKGLNLKWPCSSGAASRPFDSLLQVKASCFRGAWLVCFSDGFVGNEIR